MLLDGFDEKIDQNPKPPQLCLYEPNCSCRGSSDEGGGGMTGCILDAPDIPRRWCIKEGGRGRSRAVGRLRPRARFPALEAFGRRPPSTRRRPSSGRHPKPLTIADTWTNASRVRQMTAEFTPPCCERDDIRDRDSRSRPIRRSAQWDQLEPHNKP